MAPITAPRRRPGHATALDGDSHHASSFNQFLAPPTPPSGPPTPRSTLGSPLSTNAVRRSGVGDLAAGPPRRRNSLSEVEVLPWLCCMTPAISMFGIFSSVFVSSLFLPTIFYALTAVLTFVVMLWIGNLAFSSLLGAYYLRQGTNTDWQALLERLQTEDPTTNDVLHIVLLPNFRENERMLKDTLENLARSPMARDRVRVVLAMEAREGPAGREKAERLIQQTSHLFSDVFATFHPENLPGEVAGKSSNTQWAYREALRQYGPILLGCDLSRVFVTVGDADTLWHPQYLSALTYLGLKQPPEERSWTIWQPPILLMRNIDSVPAMTRASSHATLIFELSALANQYFFPAFAYSAYSMTLALASHPEVDGWDVDVIAEDHHMFCKCYFAALWELAHAQTVAQKKAATAAVAGKHARSEAVAATSPIVPQVQIQPVFLPAVSFLVESNGYLASLIARFEQARRHSQGVVELGYVLLQYTRLTRHTGVFNLPLRTHAAIMSIAVKMHTLHITTTAQCFALIMATLTTFLPNALRFAASGGLAMLLSEWGFDALKARALDSWGSLNFAQQALAAAVGNISGVAVLYSTTCFVVMLDLYEGRYYNYMGRPLLPREMPPVAEGDENAQGGGAEDCPQPPEEPPPSDGKPAFVVGHRSLVQRIGLFLHIFSDTAMVGYPAITFYALIPGLLASWSLLRRGTDFEYIVAVKPE